MKNLIVKDINDNKTIVDAIIEAVEAADLLSEIKQIEDNYWLGMLTDKEREGQIISAACKYYGGLHFTKQIETHEAKFKRMREVIEGAYLCGYEPSGDNINTEQRFKEAQEFLSNLQLRD